MFVLPVLWWSDGGLRFGLWRCRLLLLCIYHMFVDLRLFLLGEEIAVSFIRCCVRESNGIQFPYVPGLIVCSSLCQWRSDLTARAMFSARVLVGCILLLSIAFTCCCGCCVRDNVLVQHFDQFPANMVEAKSCTPFHCCWFIECAGGITATAACKGVNCCLCNSCRVFYPGLSNAGQFAAALNAAQTAFLEKSRLVSSFSSPSLAPRTF